MLSNIVAAALLLGQLPLAALAHPIAQRSTAMPQWTLRGFHWNCSPSQDICIYGFSLAEEPVSGNAVEVPSFCHFAIRAKNSEETAYKAGFANIPCDNLTRYRVASTFGNHGFMVLSVDNIEKHRRAYFNINIAQVESSEMAPVQQAVAYAVTQPSSPDYTDGSYVATEDYELAPTIPGALVDDSGSSDAASASDDASVFENLATQGNEDTPDDADSYGDDNDYNDYTDGPIIELADADATDAGTNDYSDSPDASIVATVAARAVGTSCADENDSDEIVFTAAYAAEASGYDDALYNNADETSETPETVDVPSLVVVADAADYPTDADDDYADEDDEADEILMVSPDDAIVAAVSATSDATYSESANGNSYNDADGHDDASRIPTVPAVPELWTMRNITRSLEYDPNAVVMKFTVDILPDGTESIPCSLRVDLDKNTDPMFGSWAVAQCRDSGWYVSWGYNQTTESAVVTLINSERNRKAWFGWDSVNARYPDVALDSVGPNIVQSCINC